MTDHTIHGNHDPNNYLLVVARLSREDADLMAEAAAEIERLRDALAPCAAILAQQRLPEGREYLIGGAFRVTIGEALDKANAALSCPHATKGEAG